MAIVYNATYTSSAVTEEWGTDTGNRIHHLKSGIDLGPIAYLNPLLQRDKGIIFKQLKLYSRNRFTVPLQTFSTANVFYSAPLVSILV